MLGRCTAYLTSESHRGVSAAGRRRECAALPTNSNSNFRAPIRRPLPTPRHRDLTALSRAWPTICTQFGAVR
jgi:hypothetical protein